MNVDDVYDLAGDRPKTWSQVVGRVIGRYLVIGTETAFCSAIFWLMKSVVS